MELHIINPACSLRVSPWQCSLTASNAAGVVSTFIDISWEIGGSLYLPGVVVEQFPVVEQVATSATTARFEQMHIMSVGWQE